MSNAKELLKRLDEKTIHPTLWAKAVQLVEACVARGSQYYAISGYRSVEEQNGLYAQGRTKPGAIVTNARGGQSAHNFGLAIDFCKDADIQRAGLQPDWNAHQYEVLAEEAKKLGLEAGLYWQFKDAPHIQLPLTAHGIKLFSAAPKPGDENNLLGLYMAGGMPAVWARIDKEKW